MRLGFWAFFRGIFMQFDILIFDEEFALLPLVARRRSAHWYGGVPRGSGGSMIEPWVVHDQLQWCVTAGTLSCLNKEAPDGK